MTTWLLEKLSSERQPLSLPLPEDVVLQPHLQGALEALEQQLLKRLAEEKEREKTDAWRTVGETLQREGVGAITVQVRRRRRRETDTKKKSELKEKEKKKTQYPPPSTPPHHPFNCHSLHS